MTQGVSLFVLVSCSFYVIWAAEQNQVRNDVPQRQQMPQQNLVQQARDQQHMNVPIQNMPGGGGGGQFMQPLNNMNQGAQQPQFFQPGQNGINPGVQPGQQQIVGKPGLVPPGAGGVAAMKGKKGPAVLISESAECTTDVRRICPESMLGSNFNTLSCLAQRKDDSDLTDECHTYVWEYKRQMSTDSRFTPMLAETCKEDLAKITKDGTCGSAEEVQKNLVSCLMLHKNKIASKKESRCFHMVNRISIIVFQDYRLIGSFYENCKNDVISLKCGSVDADQKAGHSQGYVIECLRENVKKVSMECKKEILLVAELQADDFNLDRAVYFACKEDRKQLCKNVAAGQGRVYDCLLDNSNSDEMSTECKSALSHRKKLMVEDPKVSFPLREYCMEDLERFKGECDYAGMTGEHSQMASMLLCLEFKQRNALQSIRAAAMASPKGIVLQGQTLTAKALPEGRKVNISKPLTAKCVSAMKGARKMLMSDYELNPAIVKHCSTVISDKCGGMEKGGKTLHCLMKFGKRPNPDNFDMEKEAPECFKSIEFLIRSANPIAEVSTDAVLLEACKPVLDKNCRRPNGAKSNETESSQYEKDAVGCLFDLIDDDNAMTDECSEVLLEISYFTARDWALDRRLFRACADDAREKCHVQRWATSDQSTHGETFACLYRHINHESKDLKLSDQCTVEVIRVMKSRAVRVGLNPYIEFQCRADLAQYCSDPETTGKHRELECLQDIYTARNDEKSLEPDCKAALKNYTKVETEEVEINRKLFRSCKPMIERYCAEEKRGTTNQGELFNCMVKNKNKPDVQDICAAGIEHMQLIQLKDFEFDKQFRKNCREDVQSHCPDSKSKDEVVSCLSKTIRDDRIQDRDQKISMKCREELKRPLQEKYEDVKMDREIYTTCKADIKTLCNKVKSGKGRLLECLKENKEDLSKPCRAKIFERQQEEASEPEKVQEKDYVLNRACKSMISQYCDDEQNTLKCLWKHRLADGFDEKCLKVIHKRMATKGEDVRFNAEMLKACQTDIKTQCHDVLEEAKAKSNGENTVKEYQGVVINCLRENYAKNKLSDQCSIQVRQFIRASASEWKMDFKLRMACRNIVKDQCSDKTPNKVEECLKSKFATGEINDRNDPEQKCRNEIKRVLDEGAMDIQADPVLQKTCSLDLEHLCPMVAHGKGRQLSCLIEKMNDGARMSGDCQALLKLRVQMWQLAGDRIHKLDSVGDLMSQINESSNRHYFLTIFGMLITVIFFGGLLFGRVTKRVAREMKSR
ncbi:Golgi apparatus protein 1-like isoform X3 [Convolutriloba macropyga]|uniref:Golgi apparatus protein 1-like isoform X3 n=1 Tax=Convolutriloba macropyga TaxID=536237 RepID=UPI003F51E491